MSKTALLALNMVFAVSAHADISDSGNLAIGGQAVIAGTTTIQGSAFSVGGTTFSVAAGSITLGGRLNAASAGIKWADGTTSTTASPGASGSTFSDLIVASSGIYVSAPIMSTQPANTLGSGSFDKGWVVYNSTPSTPQINRSMNVAGLVDLGTGLIRVVWNTPFEQEDYVTTCAAYRTDVTNAATCNVYAGSTHYTTNSVTILTSNFAGSGVDMKTFVRAIGRQ